MPQLPITEEEGQKLVDLGHWDQDTHDLVKQAGAFMPSPDSGQDDSISSSQAEADRAPASEPQPDMTPMTMDQTQGTSAPAGSGIPGGQAPTSDPNSAAAEIQASDALKVKPEELGLAKPQGSQIAGIPDTSGMLKDLQGYHSQEEQGIQGMANAESQAAQAKSEAYQNLSKNLDQNQKDIHDLNQKISDYADQGIKDIQKSQEDLMKTAQIDPNRLWNNMSTGNKVTAAISIALGGLGSALTGTGQNPALEIINKAIERDIDAQKMNASLKQQGVQNKMNLYQMNLRRFGDQRIALEATRAGYLQMTQAQVAQAESKMGGDKALANAQYLKGQLGQQYSQSMANLQFMLTQRAAMVHAAQGGAMPAQMIPFLGENEQKLMISMPDGSYRRGVGNPEAAAKTNDFTAKYKQVQDILGRLEDLKGRQLPFQEKAQLAQQNTAALKPLLNEINGISRFSDEDNKVVLDPQIGDPTAILQDRNMAKLANLRSIMDRKADAVYSTNVLGYKPLRVGAPRR